MSAATPAEKLFARLNPGDLVLVGARPGHGKTLMSLKLAVEAMKSGHHGVFFTLEYTEKDIVDRFRAIGADSVFIENLLLRAILRNPSLCLVLEQSVRRSVCPA